jgi:cysteine desulfurase/selenocysteine lyase
MSTPTMSLDIQRVRADFPILERRVHDRPLVYLDSAATAQKPRAVIDAIDDYYSRINANVHRGVHLLSQEATEAYEGAREKIRAFIGAAGTEEVILTSGTTDSINLVSQAYARPILAAGDEVLITHMEHHSNIVPWQMVCEQTGATLRVAPIDDRGQLDRDAFTGLLGERTKVVAVNQPPGRLGARGPRGGCRGRGRRCPSGPAHAGGCDRAGL